MNKPATNISQGCLKELYLQKQTPPSYLILQILNYQVSQFNGKQIILRVSDKETFLDCLLVGPYQISEAKIVSTEYNQSNQSFKKYDFVAISDYFCKIDGSKICQLRIIIRKLDNGRSSPQILGRPEEISQYIENSNMKYRPAIYDNQKLIKSGTEDTPIKLEQLMDQPTYLQAQNQNRSNHFPQSALNGNSQAQPLKPQGQEESLNLVDIMNSKQGYFIGRLVRMKFGCKQAKDGPMSFLYIGLIDAHGELVRVHIAGRNAIRESKQLKKGKCYLIKGLELFQGEKVKGGPQIRLRDKQYKIFEIQNEAVKSQYKHEYYRWEHENEWIESDLVDVIGVIEDIEQKITYRNTSSYQQQRDVVRLVIRNAFKVVKISFWADHIHILENLQLQRKKAILIQDIKKKKTYFLDFISESNIINLDDEPQLKEKFASFMPPFEEAPDPTNIKELIRVCEVEPYSAKIRVLPLKILSINPKWITYKMCNVCKKKMEKILQTCLECQKRDFIFKYNCPIELFDSSGSINCVAFDGSCEKIFNYSANDFSQFNEARIKQICDSLTSQEYLIGIEFKNSRQILRTIEKIRPQQRENEQIPDIEQNTIKMHSQKRQFQQKFDNILQ